MVTTDADKYWAGFLWSARSQILKKRDGFLHESQQATPFSAPYLSQMADCRFQKRLFSDIQIFSWGKKIKMFWNFKLNLSHLCISLRLWILNPKLPEAQMFPHAGSQQARQQSAPPSNLRLWATILEFLGSEVSCWRKNPHIWDSSDLKSDWDDFLQELPSREALYHLSPSLAHRSTSRWPADHWSALISGRRSQPISAQTINSKTPCELIPSLLFVIKIYKKVVYHRFLVTPVYYIIRDELYSFGTIWLVAWLYMLFNAAKFLIDLHAEPH